MCSKPTFGIDPTANSRTFRLNAYINYRSVLDLIKDINLYTHEAFEVYFYIIPLTNRVLGPCCKLPTEFFFSSGNKSKGEKRGSVTYSKDRESRVSKIVILRRTQTESKTRETLYSNSTRLQLNFQTVTEC